MVKRVILWGMVIGWAMLLLFMVMMIARISVVFFQ